MLPKGHAARVAYLKQDQAHTFSRAKSCIGSYPKATENKSQQRKANSNAF